MRYQFGLGKRFRRLLYKTNKNYQKHYEFRDW